MWRGAGGIGYAFITPSRVPGVGAEEAAAVRLEDSTHPAGSPAAAAVRSGVGALRWQIAVLVGVALAISYLDRQTLPVAIGEVRRDIPISNSTKALLDSAFLLTYGLMYVGGGRLMDVMGTRRGLTWIMVFWSLACASHGLATGVLMLAASRLLLGAGEGGGFPAGPWPSGSR
jgi:ACS family hexuronate transporter-like MFS transporter